MGGLELPRDPDDALSFVLAQYRSAFYPHWESTEDRFCWERPAERTVMRLGAHVTAKARAMRSSVRGSLAVEENRRVDHILDLLGDEQLKPDTWVRGEVVEVFRILAASGHLRTVEVVGEDGFYGALLGVDLPPVWCLETMVTVRPNGSKVALCHLVEWCHAAGYELVDVQSPHPKNHPCARLFEETISLERYLDVLNGSGRPR